MSPVGATTSDGAIYAGFWQRFGAFLADAILLLILSVLLSLIGVPMFSITEVGSDITGMTDSFIIGYSGTGILVVFVVGLFYFSLLEASPRQGTLGKMALTIRVTDLEGARIGVGQAATRYLAKFFPVPFLGFILVAFGGRKQALHDIIARCLVVSGRP